MKEKNCLFRSSSQCPSDNKYEDFTFLLFVQVSMRVDYYEPQIWTFDTATADSGDVVFDSPRFMYIGMNESYGVGNGFVGCISRVQFGDIFPLKWAMKQDYPYPGITVTVRTRRLGHPRLREWEMYL